MVTGGETSLPDRDAIESAQGVYSSIRRTFPEAVTNFESKWTPWQERCKERATWARYSFVLLLRDARKLLTLHSLDICAQGDEFEALKRLGPKIIPFIVWKLAGDADQHPYGVFLCKPISLLVCALSPLTLARQRSGERRRVPCEPR